MTEHHHCRSFASCNRGMRVRQKRKKKVFSSQTERKIHGLSTNSVKQNDETTK